MTEKPAVHGARAFPPTSWSMIEGLKDPTSGNRPQQLERLIASYWQPVYCVIRFGGTRSDADAMDLTQQFFLSVVLERGELLQRFSRERGSFRAFLKGAVLAFLHDEWRARGRQKRGGDVEFVALDPADVEPSSLIAGAEALDPEQLFDAAWTELVTSRALALMKAKLASEQRALLYELFVRHDLAEVDPAPSYKQLAEERGLTVDRVKHALTEARALFRDTVAHLVRDYVASADDLDREMRHLIGV